MLIQPGTGKVLAIANDRPYGTGPGQTEVDYAVNTQYGGVGGVQTGSSSKLFTLITALEQGVPFGFQLTVPGTDSISPYYDCAGDQTSVFNVSNSEGPGDTTDSLYTGTTQSINVFYAHLEQKVGLCNVVKTAVDLGVTRVDGKSLLTSEGPNQPQADALPTFTLGAVNVSPMSMAAAYATPAANGVYCKPIALTKIIDDAGKSIPVPSAGCHQAIPVRVAQAVNYILQGVFTGAGATAAGQGLANYPAAGKTGTSNVANGYGTPYAAFARLHHQTRGLRVGVQPGLPHGQGHDVRPERLLPHLVRLPALLWRDVRRGRPAVGMARDVRPRQPLRFRGLRAGAARQRAVERGRRADGRAAQEVQGRQGTGQQRRSGRRPELPGQRRRTRRPGERRRTGNGGGGGRTAPSSR